MSEDEVVEKLGFEYHLKHFLWWTGLGYILIWLLIQGMLYLVGFDFGGYEHIPDSSYRSTNLFWWIMVVVIPIINIVVKPWLGVDKEEEGGERGLLEILDDVDDVLEKAKNLVIRIAESYHIRYKELEIENVRLQKELAEIQEARTLEEALPESWDEEGE